MGQRPKPSSPRRGNVYSYLRFSSPEQLKGDSRRRQLELAQQWADEHGVKIDESLSDHGVSAFRGKNAQFGALGAFLKLCESGRIPKGSTLLVENLDRLSRDKVRVALGRFIDIIEAGVTIVTLCDGREYSPESCDEKDLIMSLFVMARAHEESKIKSQRLAKAWGQKRANAANKVVTSRLPSWLAMDGEKIVAVKESVKVVKEIFKLAVAGHGATVISQRLNASDLPVIAPSGKYSRKFVLHTLHSRAVIGEFQSHKLVVNDEGVKRFVKDGDPVAGYFPAVISETQFYAAQDALSRRLRTGGKSSSRQPDGTVKPAYVNLFGGLLYSALDQSKLVIIDKGRGKRLAPISGIEGYADAKPMSAFPITVLEKAILFRLADPPHAIAGSGDDLAGLSVEIAAKSGEIAALTKNRNEVHDKAVEGKLDPETVVTLLSRYDAKLRALKEEFEALKGRAAGGNDAAHLHTLFNLIERHRRGLLRQEERQDLRATIHRFVERIDCTFFKEGFANYRAEVSIVMRGRINTIDLVARALWKDNRERNERGHCQTGGERGVFTAYLCETVDRKTYMLNLDGKHGVSISTTPGGTDRIERPPLSEEWTE